MITRECFRVKVKATGEWIIGHNGEEDVTTPDKSEAIIFKKRMQEDWEDDPDYEIVPLTEAEIMDHLGQEIAPRLPGF